MTNVQKLRKQQPETINLRERDTGDLHPTVVLVSLSHISLMQLFNVFALRNKIFERNGRFKGILQSTRTGNETSHKDELHQQQLWEDLTD